MAGMQGSDSRAASSMSDTKDSWLIMLSPALCPLCVLNMFMCSMSPYGSKSGRRVSSVTSRGTCSRNADVEALAEWEKTHYDHRGHSGQDQISRDNQSTI